MIGDLHIHSMYSYDSLMDPKKILKKCKKKGYNTISITDHNSIKGSLEAKKYEKEFGISVVIGEEILTDIGDVIGLYLNQEIRNRDWIEVLGEIKAQGGVCVLPHPFRGHKNIWEVAQKVGVIEILNSHSTLAENRKALYLATKLNKPVVVGSDAHLYSEIGNAFMKFNSIFDSNKEFEFRYSKKYQKAISSIIKDIKTQKFYKIPFHLARMII